MKRLGLVTRLTTVAVVALVGAGACALDPRRDDRGQGRVPPGAAAGFDSGASAPPGPNPAPNGTPATATPLTGTTRSATPTPGARTTAPATKVPAPGRNPAPTKTPPAGCAEGERQREVETYLARLGGFGSLTVDGRQSATDCAAIKKFQRRYGIHPAEGRAGPTTAAVARRLALTETDACQAGRGTTFCVNLTLQTVWVMRGGAVVMKPTVTRTGMAGYQTPAGTFRINYRSPHEWSEPYEVWMPYWQQYTGGIGFHETTTYLHDGSIGSHGCVNLLPADAYRMWGLGGIGTTVHLFGRRPGT